jgi:hypothetical protein
VSLFELHSHFHRMKVEEEEEELKSYLIEDTIVICHFNTLPLSKCKLKYYYSNYS